MKAIAHWPKILPPLDEETRRRIRDKKLNSASASVVDRASCKDCSLAHRRAQRSIVNRRRAFFYDFLVTTLN